MTKGLALFTVGKLDEAARVWLEARAKEPANPQVRAYLRHIQSMAPEVYARVQNEVGQGPLAPAAPAPSPIAVPKPLPLTVPTPLIAVNAAPGVAALAASSESSTQVGQSGPLLGPKPSGETTSPVEPVANLDPNGPRNGLGVPRHAVALAPILTSALASEPGISERPDPFSVWSPPDDPVYEGLSVLAVGVASAERPVHPPPALIAAAPTDPDPSFESLPELELADVTASAPAEVETGPAEAPLEPGPAGEATPATAPDDPWGTTPAEDTLRVDHESSGFTLITSEPEEPETPPPAEVDFPDLESRLKELFDLDDFTGAIVVANRLLEASVGHPVAVEIKAASTQKLLSIYESKIGDKTAVPRVLLPPGELIWLDLDHRSGFVLAQIDGTSSYEEIIDLTGMDSLESHRIIATLVTDGVIGAP